MRKNKVILATALLGSLMLAGCATDLSPYRYDERQAGVASQVYRGVIADKRTVKVSGESGVGTLAGGAAGAIAGSNVGKGRGQMLGTLAGAIAGGVAGQKIDQNVNSQLGFEYTIDLDNGSSISIVQGPPELQIGQRVKVYRGPKDRVVSDYQR